MSWTVYVRTNRANGKKYVGVTSKGESGRWESMLLAAQQIKHAKEAFDARLDISPATERRLRKLVGTIEYDIALGAEDWNHDEVMVTDNLIQALLTERRLITEHACRRPKGYNLSSGGEVPPWTNVVDLIRWVSELNNT